VIDLEEILVAVLNQHRDELRHPGWSMRPHRTADADLGSVIAALFDQIGTPWPGLRDDARSAPVDSDEFSGSWQQTRLRSPRWLAATLPGWVMLARASAPWRTGIRRACAQSCVARPSALHSWIWSCRHQAQAGMHAWPTSARLRLTST
jgi:hypothetical protein